MKKGYTAKWILPAVIGFASAQSLFAQSSGQSRERYEVKGDDNPGCVAIPNPSGARPKQVSGGVLNAKALELPDPKGGRASAKGRVSVQILVGEDGAVAWAAGVSGDKGYHTAAMDAARKAKFEPTLLNGFPVKMSGVIFYMF